MAQSNSFSCKNCGVTTSKWTGKCESCGKWNSLESDTLISTGVGKTSLGKKPGQKLILSDLKTVDKTPPRISSSINELDRALGGGLVLASAILVGGDPGIGKSTLLLQAATCFSKAGINTLYISGEEASTQIKMRASRLGIRESKLKVGSETNLRNILTTISSIDCKLVILDSIQTIWADSVDSAPGSVSQVRAVAYELTSFAKRHGVSIIMVGHVTKDGQIAGPRVVEHMVDTVLYFEGENNHQHRILRAVKNRFGPSGEIGVFEMTGTGLKEVTNPSEVFLTEREYSAPGSAVFAGVEGTRPLLTEFQALVSPTPHSQPRRTVVGWDSARLAMVLAVLEARCGISFSSTDVYLNVAGGLKITEPAADLAVAAALLSALYDKKLPAEMLFFGEISLSGRIRPVSQLDIRIKEAQKLGFSKIVCPRQTKQTVFDGIEFDNTEDLSSFTKANFVN